MTQQPHSTFDTISERPITTNGKEFRIAVTYNRPKDRYTVGIREYTRTERYTGYSKNNGVTIPAPDLETANILATSIALTLEATGSIGYNLA